jgi:glycosyltransferase involved in cell wall biosynthesis
MISIIMPVWNGSRFLDRAIASVLAQTSFEWELIIVDDASTDDSVKRIERWRSLVIDHLGEEKVRIESNGVNSGSSVARNRGVAAARHDIITYLDCDDILFAHRVEILCQIFRMQNSAFDLLFAPYEIFENGKRKLWHVGAMWEKAAHTTSSTGEREPPFALWARAYLQRGNLSIPLGIAHRKEIFEKVGGFQTGIILGQEGVLCRRMADKGARIGLCPAPAGRYFVRPDSQARTERLPSTGGFKIQKDHPLGPNGQYLDAEWFASLENKKKAQSIGLGRKE